MLHARSAARLGLTPLACHGFALGIEAGISQRLTLVQCQVDIVDCFAVQLRPEQIVISRLSFRVIPARPGRAGTVSGMRWIGRVHCGDNWSSGSAQDHQRGQTTFFSTWHTNNC